MSEDKNLSISGQIDGQKLWKTLSAEAQKMKTAWCRTSGNGNVARSQQLTQMLNKYLAERYPKKIDQDKGRLDTMIKWNGIIDDVVTFTVSSQVPKGQKMLDDIRRLILKPQ